MPTPYIPPKDADFNNWVINFSDLLTASPATYGQTAPVAASVQAVADDWVAKYALAINPSTRTPVTVQDKNDAHIAAVALIRPIAVQISLNAGVLSADKIAIGVNPRTNTPTPVSAPTTAPVLNVSAGAALQHILRYRDEAASPTSKAKPAGVFQCQVFAMASVTPITDQEAIAYKGFATVSPTPFAFDAGDTGKQIYYAARWVTRKGLVGPWSSIVSLTLQNS